jgi:hypothetical protein
MSVTTDQDRGEPQRCNPGTDAVPGGLTQEQGGEGKYLELYKVFRDQDIRLLDYQRNVFQIWVTLILTITGATFVVLKELRPEGLLLIGAVVGPLANLLLCPKGHSLFMRAAKRYLQNITTISNLTYGSTLAN